MPKFSKMSEYKLSTCHPDLVTLFHEVVKIIDCTVTEGYRGRMAQNKALAEGKSTLAYPHGKHNTMPSNAVDVYPYPIDMKNTNRFFWFSGYVLGVADQLYQQGKMKHRIRYGGDWNRNYDITDEKGIRDLVHFEIIEEVE